MLVFTELFYTVLIIKIHSRLTEHEISVTSTIYIADYYDLVRRSRNPHIAKCGLRIKERQCNGENSDDLYGHIMPYLFSNDQHILAGSEAERF